MQWLTTKSINHLNPMKWLRQYPTEKITGEKIFSDNLHLSRPFNVLGLTNGVDIRELDRDVMKISGDQVISGHKFFSIVSAER